MNRSRFDESIVIGILSGGIVTVVSNAVQFNVNGEVGGLAAVFFALGYAGYMKYKNKTSSQDSTSDENEKSQPNNHPSEQTKIVDKAGSKKLLLADYFIIFIMALCLGGAVYSYFVHQPPIPYSETSTDFLKDYPNETFAHTSFNFTSEVFSAQSEIHVDIITDIDPTFANKHHDVVDSIQKILILLPDSTPKNPTYERGHLLSVPIVLTLDPINQYYKGNGTIIYQAEGDKCYILTTNTPPETTHTCLPNATPIIHISSADSLFQLNSNRLNTSLTLVVIAFTVVSIRDFARYMVENKSRLKVQENKGDSKSKHNSKNKHS